MPKQTTSPMPKPCVVRASVAGHMAEKLRQYAEERGQTLAEVVREAVADWVQLIESARQARVEYKEVFLPNQPPPSARQRPEPTGKPSNEMAVRRLKKGSLFAGRPSPFAT